MRTLRHYPQKKTARYRERDEAERAAFQQQLGEFDNDQVVWVDECGMHQDLYRPYACSPRGERVYADVEDKRFAPRISVIAVYMQGHIQAPLRFEGYTDSLVFDIWVERCLVPTLRPGLVIVLDNATFHKSSRTRKLIEAAHCQLLFQPAYSPDLNKIEPQWATLKQGIRTNQQSHLSFLEKLDLQLVKMSSP